MSPLIPNGALQRRIAVATSRHDEYCRVRPKERAMAVKKKDLPAKKPVKGGRKAGGGQVDY
jgi:hypothetical protein